MFLELYKFIFTNIWTWIGTIGIIFAIGEVIVASIKSAGRNKRYNVLGELLEDTLDDYAEEEQHS